MEYSIKDPSWLRKILWLETALGGLTALLGFAFRAALSDLMGLSEILLTILSVIALLYALGALVLAKQEPVPVPRLNVLIYANWAWAAASPVLLLTHLNDTTILGVIFFVLQVPVVMGFAALASAQIEMKRAERAVGG